MLSSVAEGLGTSGEMLTVAELHQMLWRIQNPSLSSLAQFNERNTQVNNDALKTSWMMTANSTFH